MVKHPEFIQKIDWKLLREQKQELFNVIEQQERSFKSSSEIINSLDNLYGILHLIDAIQDYSVDEMGLSEKEVFNFKEE